MKEEIKVGDWGFFKVGDVVRIVNYPKNGNQNKLCNIKAVASLHNNGMIELSNGFLFNPKELEHLELFKKSVEPTREEITAKWVKDNDIKVGDKVRVVNAFEDSWLYFTNHNIGEVLKVNHIYSDNIELQSGNAESSYYYPVEFLEKVTEEYRPYTFEDRDEFRDLWAIDKNDMEEYRVSSIRENGVFLGSRKYTSTYENLFTNYTKRDVTPFGKEL